MTTTQYEPRQTRQWSTHELAALIGKHVSISQNGSEVAGVVDHASVGRYGMPFIDFTSGASVHWHRDTDDVYITVSDEPTGDPA